MPKRIQLQRTKGWRKPEGAIVVSRPSRWGNPYMAENIYLTVGGVILGPGVGRYDPADARYLDMPAPDDLPISNELLVALYRRELLNVLDEPEPYFDEIRTALEELRGHDLACWCPLVDAHGQPVPCHADVLIDLANRLGHG